MFNVSAVGRLVADPEQKEIREDLNLTKFRILINKKKGQEEVVSAIDCNLFNTGGACDHESGFPSGHVTLISYFCFYIYFNYYPLLMRYLYRGGYDDDDIENENHYTMKRSFLLFLCIVPVIMMGYARYMKKCHNLVQVVAGAVTGYAISKFIIKLNKHEINENEESLTKTV